MPCEMNKERLKFIAFHLFSVLTLIALVYFVIWLDNWLMIDIQNNMKGIK